MPGLSEAACRGSMPLLLGRQLLQLTIDVLAGLLRLGPGAARGAECHIGLLGAEAEGVELGDLAGPLLLDGLKLGHPQADRLNLGAQGCILEPGLVPLQSDLLLQRRTVHPRVALVLPERFEVALLPVGVRSHGLHGFHHSLNPCLVIAELLAAPRRLQREVLGVAKKAPDGRIGGLEVHLQGLPLVLCEQETLLGDAQVLQG
mmetsp:Transcript_77070/g.195631  ORF Transcript_77070/g.195631 Transcript_77070/m.195631 type:complete len:203 (+) Transcript_77070:680-1288(+)